MQDTSAIHRLLLLSLFVGLMLLSFQILKPFIVPVVWAAILAYITWPIYQAILRKLGQRKNLSALIMTAILSILIGVPVVMAIFMLQHEGRELYFKLQEQLFSGSMVLPDPVKSIPIIGQELNNLVTHINTHPDDIAITIRGWIQDHIGFGKMVVGEISRNVFKLSLAILTLFFFYRDGSYILDQVRTALNKVIGYRVHNYLDSIGKTTNAVVYGVGLTALAQALLSGLGYWVAGAPNPMVLTFGTFLLALIPFGAPLAWGSVSIWLLAQGHTLEAAGLAAWGVFGVSWIDNVIRPIVISGATKIPFILIMFGVLGGLASFGMVGVFIGPVVLAVLLAVWREWLHQKSVEPEPEQQRELFEDHQPLL